MVLESTLRRNNNHAGLNSSQETGRVDDEGRLRERDSQVREEMQ